MRKPLFYNFRSLILASKTDKQIMFFQSNFLDPLFLIFFELFQKWSFWGPLQNPMGPKTASEIYQMVPKRRKSRRRVPETTLRPRRHHTRFKPRFGSQRFCFWSVLVCYISVFSSRLKLFYFSLIQLCCIFHFVHFVVVQFQIRWDPKWY